MLRNKSTSKPKLTKEFLELCDQYINNLWNELIELKSKVLDDKTVEKLLAEFLKYKNEINRHNKELDIKEKNIRSEPNSYQQYKNGYLKRFFISGEDKELTEKAKTMLYELDKQRRYIPEDIKKYEVLKHRQSSEKREIDRKEKFLLNFEKTVRSNKLKYQIQERKRADQDLLKQRAKNNTDEKRAIATSVRKNITNEDCPYCGVLLDKFCHADHIYPVSKGGLSTLRNMVMTCSQCNLKKKNLTLRSFIKKFNLDLHKIEEKLDSLDKDF